LLEAPENMRRLRPCASLVLAISLLLAWVLAYQHVKRMDGVWFQPSPAGAWALAQYLAGDYVGAARAYRTHYREAVATGWSSGDPALDALLAGDLDRAASAARTGTSGERGFLLTMADIALERGRPDEAMVFLRQALQRAPDDAEALLLASLAHARADAPGEAIVTLTRALRQSAAGARVTIFLRMLETTGELARRQGAGRQPCLLAHYHRYLAVFDPSSGRRAIGYAEQAIRAGDRPADAHLVRGILLDRQGQRDRALEAFLEALEIDPRHAEAYRWATFIYAERGDLRNEYRIARAAFDAAPTDSFYLDHLDHVLTERLADPHGVIAVMQRAVEADPDNVRAHDRLGHAWGFVGDQTRSVSHYQQAIRREPANAVLHEGLGRALHRLDRGDEAIAAYQQAVRIAPRRYQPHTGLASVYHGGRRYREAIAEYETAVRLGEPAPGTQAALCAAYHALPEHPRAVACFEGRR
jgi:tetratricopeptide (TPR) repeat protein